MSWLPALAVLPPGLFWLWYIYRQDRYRPEPWWLIAMVFTLGTVSTKLVEGATYHLGHWLHLRMGSGLLPHIIYFIVMVGLIEEGVKLLVTAPVVLLLPRVDEVVDAVVLSGAAALGFATMENILYVSVHGAEVLAGRAILSTFGHVLMSSIWGFSLGVAKTRQMRLRFLVPVAGWIGAACVHGLYDAFLISNWFPAAVLLLYVMWRTFVAQIALTWPDSPHRPRRARRVVECPHCRGLSRAGARYCSACGRPAGEVPAEVWCSACLKPSGTEATCASCACELI